MNFQVKVMTNNEIFDRYFYHGSPCSIDTFSYKFLGHGMDHNGSGFYFITQFKEAKNYCEFKRHHEKLITDASQPTIHKVKLAISNPLLNTTIEPLSKTQVKAIMRRSPVLEQRIVDYGEPESEGLENVINYAAESMIGHDDSPLILTLNMLSTDFFGDHIEEFNCAIRDILGYDGLLAQAEDKHWIAVAWFPDQIKIVQRIPYREPSNDLDEGMTP